MQDVAPTALVRTVARYFSGYLEIHGLTGEQYYFRKASTSLRDAQGNPRVWHPRTHHTMLRGFHGRAEGILYAAMPKAARLDDLQPSDLLYIGCSASGGARYWRGRPGPCERFGTPSSCFHHEQMRRGRDGNNLERHLAESGPVVVHTLTDETALRIASEHGICLGAGRYPAHQLEVAILAEGYTRWAWNRRR